MEDIQTPAAEKTASPELTIVDLQNLRAILDTASRRGAFAAAEMTSVGSCFDRLNNFLNAVAPAGQTAAPESSEVAPE
jgi:hypothetical protein